MTSGFSWVIGWPSEARHSWSFFFEVLGFDFSAKSSEERGLRGFADIKRELPRVGKWYGGFRGISLGSAPTIWAVPAPWEALISINEVGPKLIRGGENRQLADFVVFFFWEESVGATAKSGRSSWFGCRSICGGRAEDIVTFGLAEVWVAALKSSTL